jgi:hypothetical protein
MASVGSTASKRARKNNRSKIEVILSSPGSDSGGKGGASGPELLKKLEEKVREYARLAGPSQLGLYPALYLY